jgi:predicted nucleic acid-binding protein
MPTSRFPSTVLLDTNVLLRATVTGDPLRQCAIDAISVLEAAGTAIHVCAQNMTEFRQVATRPTTANGLGWSSHDVALMITGFEQRYSFTIESPGIYPAWRRIVEGCTATGRANFDARLVAVATAATLGGVLTFEAAAFARYVPFATGVAILDPNSFAGLAP